MEHYYEMLLNLIRNSDCEEEDKKNLKQYLEDMYNNSEKCIALEQGGVDNWEWYDESLRDYFGEEED